MCDFADVTLFDRFSACVSQAHNFGELASLHLCVLGIGDRHQAGPFVGAVFEYQDSHSISFWRFRCAWSKHPLILGWSEGLGIHGLFTRVLGNNYLQGLLRTMTLTWGVTHLRVLRDRTLHKGEGRSLVKPKYVCSVGFLVGSAFPHLAVLWRCSSGKAISSWLRPVINQRTDRACCHYHVSFGPVRKSV